MTLTKKTTMFSDIYLVLVLSDVATFVAFLPLAFSLARVRDWLALATGDAAATGEKEKIVHFYLRGEADRS